ncbi:MAG: hypothetical protein C4519_28620, partial [Desulfobacteraceae bacterium]
MSLPPFGVSSSETFRKTYLKYFVPSAPGSANGLLNGVNQSDINDTITLGTYFIKELPYGKAVIVMDLL